MVCASKAGLTGSPLVLQLDPDIGAETNAGITITIATSSSGKYDRHERLQGVALFYGYDTR